MARAFTAEGMNIVLADIESEVLSKAADEIRNLNVYVMALKVDVSDRSSLRDAAGGGRAGIRLYPSTLQ